MCFSEVELCGWSERRSIERGGVSFAFVFLLVNVDLMMRLLARSLGSIGWTVGKPSCSAGVWIYVPDGVASAEANPLRDRAVLLLGLGQLDLGAERLVALFVDEEVRQPIFLLQDVCASSIQFPTPCDRVFLFFFSPVSADGDRWFGENRALTYRHLDGVTVLR